MTVTTTDVKAIIDTKLKPIGEEGVNIDQLAPFLDQATLVISEELVGSSLSEARIDLITKYLTAHFIALTEEYGSLAKVIIGDSEVWTHDNSGKGLEGTRYGQQVLALDTTGILRIRLGDTSRLKARLTVL